MNFRGVFNSTKINEDCCEGTIEWPTKMVKTRTTRRFDKSVSTSEELFEKTRDDPYHPKAWRTGSNSVQ